MKDLINKWMRDPAQIVSVRKNGTVRVSTKNSEKSLTQQQFKDECDINNIMRKYSDTGQFTHLTQKTGMYADFSNIQDYQTMLDTVRYADEAFNTLPAQIRARFRNNPGDLLEFLQDPKNEPEAIALGLAIAKPQIPTPSVPQGKKQQKQQEPSEKNDD